MKKKRKPIKYWLGKISEKLGTEINNIPQLRALLLEKWGKYPVTLGSLSHLETVAKMLCVNGARKCVVSIDWHIPVDQHKSKISKDEIFHLRELGFPYSKISKMAGVSRQRVWEICNKC
jgi:hypothetical protein